MNGREIGQIARAVAALRPDWSPRSLGTFLANRIGDDLALDAGSDAGELAARTYDEVALALIWVALRTETETPFLVTQPGPWWTVPASDGQPGREQETWVPLRREDECEQHPGQPRATCRSCAADRIAAERPAEPGATRRLGPVESGRAPADHVASAREGIRRSRQRPEDAEGTEPATTPEPEATRATLPASQRSRGPIPHRNGRGAQRAVSGALVASGSAKGAE